MAGVDPCGRPGVGQGLDLGTGVTLLVGENDSGKSTLVEAIAMVFGLAVEGGTRNVQDGTRATESPLHGWITLERSAGAPRWGFFLRAETMHGYFTRQESFSSERDPLFHDMGHGSRLWKCCAPGSIHRGCTAWTSPRRRCRAAPRSPWSRRCTRSLQQVRK